MLNKIIIVYLNFLLLFAGISVIFLTVESGDHQIIYAQVSTSPEGFPEGHLLAPPQGSPQETSPGITPNSQISPSFQGTPIPPTQGTPLPRTNTQIPFDGSPDGIQGIPPNSQIPFDGSPDGIQGIPPNSQIPFDGSPDGIQGIPPNSQIPPSSQGTPTPPTNTQVPPVSSQPLANTQVPPVSSQPPIPPQVP